MTQDLPGLPQQIAHFEARLQADPTSRVYLPLADLYRRDGKSDQARSVLVRGLQGDPGCISARALLGVVLTDLGEREAARGELLTVLSHDPDNLMALRLLGDDAASTGDWPKACEFWVRLLRLQPEAADLRLALREACSRLAIEADAVAVPSGPLAQQGEHRREDGRHQAHSGTDQEADPRPAPDVAGVETPTLADLYRQQGHPQKARRIIERILAADPGRPDALAVLARLDQDVLAADSADVAPTRKPGYATNASQAVQKVEPPARDRKADGLKRFRNWLDAGGDPREAGPP